MEKKEIIDFFNLIDKDKNGKISKEELYTALEKMLFYDSDQYEDNEFDD